MKMSNVGLLLWCATAFAQSPLITPVTILPKSDRSASGILDFRDTVGPTGYHTFGLRAKGTMAGSLLYTLWDVDSAGCVQSDGSGNLSIAPCSGAGSFVTLNTIQTITANKTFSGASILTNGTGDIGSIGTPWNNGFFNNVNVNNLTVNIGCAGCGGSSGPNVLLTNSVQTILSSGTKTFASPILASGGVNIGDTVAGYFGSAYLGVAVEAPRARIIFGTPNAVTDYFDLITDATHLFHIKNSSSANLFQIDDTETLGGPPIFEFLGPVTPYPGHSNAYSLGSALNYWATLFLGTSLKMGSSTILDSSGNATVNTLTCTTTPCGAAGVITSISGSAPIVVSPSTGAVSVTCLDCDALSIPQTIVANKIFSGSVTFNGGISINGTCTGTGCGATLSANNIFTGSNTFNGGILSNGSQAIGNTIGGHFSQGYFGSTLETPRLRVISGTPNSVSDYFDIAAFTTHNLRMLNSSSTILMQIDDTRIGLNPTFFEFGGDIVSVSGNNVNNIGGPSLAYKSLYLGTSLLVNNNTVIDSSGSGFFGNVTSAGSMNTTGLLGNYKIQGNVVIDSGGNFVGTGVNVGAGFVQANQFKAGPSIFGQSYNVNIPGMNMGGPPFCTNGLIIQGGIVVGCY